MKRTKAVAVSHVSGAQNTPNCVCGRGSALDPAGRGRLTALFELPIAGFKGAAWRQGGEDRVESGGGKRGKEGEEGTEKKQERAGWSLLLHRSCVIETNLAVKWRNKTEFCPWQAHSSSSSSLSHSANCHVRCSALLTSLCSLLPASHTSLRRPASLSLTWHVYCWVVTLHSL